MADLNRSRRRAQIRTSTDLAGAPKAAARPARTVLARRELQEGGFVGEVCLWREHLLEVRCMGHDGMTYQLVLPQLMLGERDRAYGRDGVLT